MTNDKNNENNQTAEEWANAFNPSTPKYQKTYTELMHEKQKRAEAELQTEEGQLFTAQLAEGLKNPHDQ